MLWEGFEHAVRGGKYGFFAYHRVPATHASQLMAARKVADKVLGIIRPAVRSAQIAGKRFHGDSKSLGWKNGVKSTTSLCEAA